MMTPERRQYIDRRLERLSARLATINDAIDISHNEVKAQLIRDRNSTTQAITRWKRIIADDIRNQVLADFGLVGTPTGQDELRCTYPTCKCIVSTSTTQPEPDCPRGLPRE